MISRSARRVEDQSLISQQDSARKFGNIVNRLEKSAQLTPSKGHQNSKFMGLQNLRPLTSVNLQEKNDHEDESYMIHVRQPIQHSHQISQVNDQGKKQGIGRNREFVAKVENINKIHDQINSLLKYVKNEESKSVLKNKDGAHGKSMRLEQENKGPFKEWRNEERVKYKKEEQGLKRPYLEAEMDQKLIAPVTQQQKSNYRKSPAVNVQPSPTKIKVNGAEKKTTPASKYNYNYEFSNGNQEKKPKMFDIKELQKFPPRKFEEKSTTPKRNQKEETQKRQTYCYNFTSGQNEVQIVKSRNVEEYKEQKIERSIINYDYEIEKVKERIQSSEQMTKKMEQKYLASHQKSYNHEYAHQKVKRFQVEESSPIKAVEESKIRSNRETRAFVVKNQNERSRKFELKVYPCAPSRHENLRKDEACKLIAEKLSQQIKLDQKLRDARQVFNDCKAVDKWKSLQERLSKLGYSFSQTELENQLAISSSESNPFSVESNSTENSIQKLAETFAKSEEFWQKSLIKFISRSSLDNSGFNASEMDLDQRGYLTVEDLVCFVNLYSSNFFRNRDIICLFRRMTALGKNRNGIDYEIFMDIIASP